MPAPRLRPQQRRIKWPLTPNQVEAIDEMLETLFRAVRNLDTNIQTVSTQTPTVIQNTIFLPSDDSGGGNDEMCLVGGAGSSGTGGSVNMAIIATRVWVGV